MRFIVTGTDTEIGKTVFSAALMCGLERAGMNPKYWKPVQSGIEGETDKQCVQRLSALPGERFIKERYVLNAPLSPHRSAELDSVEINPDDLSVPGDEGALIIEGAGGLMVPLTRRDLYIDLFKRWDIPLILCARTGLGTINHTLLSIEAIRARDLEVLGVVFIGPENPDNMNTIAQFSDVRVLGHLPVLDDLNASTLGDAFERNFRLEDFKI